MTDRIANHWGWGWADRFPDRDARANFAAMASGMFGFAASGIYDPVALEAIQLRAPRIAPPAALSGFITGEAADRIRHTYGRNYGEVARGFAGDFTPAPDLVAYPKDEADVVRTLDWASSAGVIVIPYGGGTSVVGGVTLERSDKPVMVLDLRSLDRVLEVDSASQAARIQAGARGPVLEFQLAGHGLTLRHFPQSFEFSTLGGWIATRAGGHFATLYTHIDDLVQSTRTVTPRGIMETRRLPGSGAGPAPDRLVIGSEGILGVITEAWMRVRPRPVFRATASVLFSDYAKAVDAVRALSQSGLYPTNCRLLDPHEARLNMVAMDGSSVLIVAFESADHALGPWMARALELTADHGGTCPAGPVFKEGGERSGDAGEAGAWKQQFIEAPYMLNLAVSLGLIADTFETACTWDRFPSFHAAVEKAMRDALQRVCGGGRLSCRFTHVYPDGPAPYYTFVAPGAPGRAIDQWRALKDAAMDAVVSNGGTITHHHAVGRFHRPGYDRERPPVFAEALKAAKRALDPSLILNPGVLVDI